MSACQIYKLNLYPHIGSLVVFNIQNTLNRMSAKHPVLEPLSIPEGLFLWTLSTLKKLLKTNSMEKLYTTMQEFADQHPEHKEIIKETIIAVLSIKNNSYCSVCHKMLSEKEIEEISSNDFWITCLEHKRFAQQYQITNDRQKINEMSPIPHPYIII